MALAIPRRAFFTLAARGEGHAPQPYTATEDVLPSYFTMVKSMLCSFRLWRSAYPMILIAVNLTKREQQELLESGADRILDLTKFDTRPFLPQQSQPSWWPNCTTFSRGIPLWHNWNRKDMHKTLYKFAIWNATEFDEVAFVDADVAFLRKPDSFFEALVSKTGMQKGILFPFPAGVPPYVCTPEEKKMPNLSIPLCETLDFVGSSTIKAGCQLYGWNAGFFVTRPNPHTYLRLVTRSRSGDFPWFTNTEQDVLEAEFEPPQCPGRASPRSPLLPPPSVASPSCRRTAITFYAWQNSVMTHHRIKDDLRSQKLATAICSSQRGTAALVSKVGSRKAPQHADRPGGVNPSKPLSPDELAEKELHLRLYHIVKSVKYGKGPSHARSHAT
jgi:hypothetical protein